MVALNNINEAGNRRWVGEQGSRGGRRSQAKLWVAVGIAVVATAWLAYSYRQSDAVASAPAALPQVVVSKPLERSPLRPEQARKCGNRWARRCCSECWA
jgi:hypothetical protein